MDALNKCRGISPKRRLYPLEDRLRIAVHVRRLDDVEHTTQRCPCFRFEIAGCSPVFDTHEDVTRQ